ncbi:MAG TPA: M3 family metallopeptidase [Rhizobiaceae bacterium]|nr:M3 family metallopeptidase [Rhizobiaceae bacterium]
MTETPLTPNPALTNWTEPLGLPEFAAITDEDYKHAFDAALAAHRAEIDAIAAQTAMPSFDNTILALERAGEALSRVSALFWLKAGTDTNPAIQTLEREIAPAMSRHFSAVAMNAALFARVDALWQSRKEQDWTVEQARVVERTWKGFVRAGAALGADDQKRLAAIGERLAELGACFGQNVLADESSWALILEAEADLAGLPPFLRDAMAAAAKARGHEGKHAVTLSRSIVVPFLTLSERRDLREQAWRAWTARGENGGETDNRAIIAETLSLRAERARLLGHDSFAALKLDDTMAKTPQAVNDLLGTVWEKALSAAAAEEMELQAVAASAGLNHDIAGWDWRFLAEQLKAQKHAFSEGELKPYLKLERVAEAAFDVAGRLFGLTFIPRPDVAGWLPDVKVFEVREKDGALKGVFLADYFARPSKRSGAWMSALQGQHAIDGGRIPIIYNVMNFGGGDPALLSLDDARTLFHEFGHALHGLLSDVTYPSVAGTAVSRDFVELPSQLYEHWLTTPQVLSAHARHHETGEAMPQALVDKVLAARNFNAGFDTVEFTASALIDMAYHARADAPNDPAAFEAAELQRLALPAAIPMRHRSPHFQHVFAGEGYAAGYYSYMWSEVLDADAFQAFEEAGDPFDPATAEKLRRHVYASGGSLDPEAAYIAFRGRLPTPDAMLRKRGLA